VPNGIWGYYTDAEVDALLAALQSGGGLQTVDLSAYATTAYVDGQIATVYSKAEVDAAIKVCRDEGALDLDAVQNQVLFAVTETARQLQERIDLKAPQATTYTKTEVDEAIANAATGGTVDLNGYAKAEDLPAVYEQDAQPAGKDGDLWLSTPVAKAAEISALVTKADTKDLDAHVAKLVRSLMAGGKTVPPDIDWTACTKVLGSGLIEARVLNGMIQLRGELAYTLTATGSLSTVQRLPANFPKPPVEQTVLVFGFENGVAYRRVFLRFQPDGGIAICGDGKITGTSFNGAQAYAY
jgi:hypothetical protein